MLYRIDNSAIDTLKGKRILFFAPAFFGYEKKIADKMTELGAEVDLYDERSVSSSIEKALIKISPKIFALKSLNYYKRIIRLNDKKKYDYIFVIKGDMIPVKILKELRIIYPDAKLCLYLYDSVANIPGIQKKLKYFDSCHSFDPNDCDKYSLLKFKPLFFCDQFRKPANLDDNYLYDISFLGTIHSDRYRIIKDIQCFCNNSNLTQKWFLFLQSSFIYYFYRVTKKEFWHTKKSDFDYVKMNSNEIADIVDNTKVVIDIQHPKQTGLTMRTIEMLGMNKKIITTNSTIKNYDFYNPKNIYIIDRNDFSINMDFFSSPYHEIDKEIYENYSIYSWIRTVLY